LVSGSELPLTLVASLMHQYGLDLDIDIVEAGCHVPAGSSYRTVYSQFVGPRHIVGERRTWLVLRLNVLANLDRIVEQGPSRRAAPKALAVAAHRVVQRLRQEQILAHALSAEEIDAMTAILLDPVGQAQNREKWSMMRSGPNFITTYVGHPEMLADGQFDRWWSWRTEETVTLVRLTAATASSEVQVGVLVRYVQHGKAYKPLPETKLALPPGIQRQMLEATLPAGDRSLKMVMPTVDLSVVQDVRLPVGPSGQILGQLDEGTVVAAALWDQSEDPKRQRIDAQVGVEVARQLVLRAVVTGAVVAIHTNDRPRWEGLVATVNDESRLFYATAGARTCDIAVFDGRTVTTVPARTVLRLLELEPDAAASGADMSIIEGPGQVLEVRVNGAEPVTVWSIRTREEDRYLGLGYDKVPQPRRVVSTAPVLSRTPRRPATTPAESRRPGPPAEATAAVAVERNGDGRGAAPGGRHRDIAPPQRVVRNQRPAEAQPPVTPRRPPRDYRPRPPDQPPPPLR
jgi:hypothetical protein